jgi:hypothetical protein
MPAFPNGKRRKKFNITCEWCGEIKETADPKAKYCCDQHRLYAFRARKETARVVSE